MFLFARLENAAKVDSLFKNPSKPARAPSGGASAPASGGATSESAKPEGAQTRKAGEKLPQPDPKYLESLFQGMVDPATPAHKKKAGKGETEDTPAEVKGDLGEAHEGHEKGAGKEGGPGKAPEKSPAEPVGEKQEAASGKKKKKKGEGEEAKGKDGE